MSPDNNQAFGVVYTVNPFKAFFMTQNHDRSCKPVSKCTGIRHNGNAYNAVADRVSVSRVQYMRKTLSAQFEIISVITAGCKAFVMEVHNFIDLIERRTGLGLPLFPIVRGCSFYFQNCRTPKGFPTA